MSPKLSVTVDQNTIRLTALQLQTSKTATNLKNCLPSENHTNTPTGAHYYYYRYAERGDLAACREQQRRGKGDDMLYCSWGDERP